MIRFNNHIHTYYSFSPYSPAMAATEATAAGLKIAGIIDHDSVAGIGEFLEAGRREGIGVTSGFEFRVSFVGTPFADRRLNNPDQKGIAYVVCHGLPCGAVKTADTWLRPYRAARLLRSREMTARLNDLMGEAALSLDFDGDVIPLSRYQEGGTLTERHIMFAMARKFLARFGPEEMEKAVLDLLNGDLTEGDRKKLRDPSSPWYDYHIMGIFKAHLIPRIYVDATEECPPVAEFTEFVDSVGAIPTYPYLGDVKNSVTGDKKDMAFEDACIDELAAWVSGNGFRALSYMPGRNTREQLTRVIGLADVCGLFQISGEDINAPGQPFVCEKMSDPMYAHLVDSAWALVGHEAASREGGEGMFRKEMISRMPELSARIAYFAGIGRKTV
jgi:hypothetical protein